MSLFETKKNIIKDLSAAPLLFFSENQSQGFETLIMPTERNKLIQIEQWPYVKQKKISTEGKLQIEFMTYSFILYH